MSGRRQQPSSLGPCQVSLRESHPYKWMRSGATPQTAGGSARRGFETRSDSDFLYTRHLGYNTLAWTNETLSLFSQGPARIVNTATILQPEVESESIQCRSVARTPQKNRMREYRTRWRFCRGTRRPPIRLSARTGVSCGWQLRACGDPPEHRSSITKGWILARLQRIDRANTCSPEQARYAVNFSHDEGVTRTVAMSVF